MAITNGEIILLSGQYSLSAPVGHNWDVMNAYKYDNPFKEDSDADNHE